MDEQHESDGPTDKKTVVKSSIKKLKKKFVPGVKYSLLCSAAFQIAMLVIGCLNVHKCPVEKHIPLFLIATGAIGLMSKYISYIRDRISAHIKVIYIESALYSAETVFVLLGTYWVYKEFQPNYDSNSGNLYCNKTAYLFAFCFLTIIYTIMLAIVFGFCCFVCCAVCLAATTPSTTDPETQNIDNSESSSKVSTKLREATEEP